MLRTRIKICGIREPDHARAAVAAGADAIGLVFAEQSPRHVTPEQAHEIVQAIPAFIDIVGLFADHTAEQIHQIVVITGIRTLQLHGSEPTQLIDNLPNLPIIKALPFIPDAATRYTDWLYHPRTRAILWDTPPDANNTWGGTGKSFPWEPFSLTIHAPAAAGWPLPILAGGLNPANVAEAIRTTKPYAVDVSTGVEANRGVKDIQRIVAFCRAVRKADTTR
ncbi:phosphoribosylanthranilate isomerase [Mucisphaera sp.]|uniref:phosphoribosylanthranilate isomerase n=1 Tax=Mucisphaera sp. TaxID=2913024 RepID=UPI003D11452E